jgi:tyrosine-protein phosphatase YwqE
MLKSIFNIFRKKEAPLPDYSGLGTDMHSHLIPGVDDGAKEIEDSIELIRNLHDLGFRKLYTTPHIMSDYFRNNPENIGEGLERVRKAISDEGIEMELHAAAEYYLDDGFTKKLENEKLLTISGNYLLFEISYINCPDNVEEIIFRMQVQGYIPVLAHPERYPFWYGDFDKYKKLKDMGALFQVNTNSIGGYYGPDARRAAAYLVHNNMVDLLGTDCHHLRHIEGLHRTLSSPLLRKAMELNLLNSKL